MGLTVKELKEKVEGLPEDTVLCVGEEGEYITIDKVEFGSGWYTDKDGEDKEGNMLLMESE